MTPWPISSSGAWSAETESSFVTGHWRNPACASDFSPVAPLLPDVELAVRHANHEGQHNSERPPPPSVDQLDDPEDHADHAHGRPQIRRTYVLRLPRLGEVDRIGRSRIIGGVSAAYRCVLAHAIRRYTGPFPRPKCMLPS